jgi:class 3 adenylate cyclase
METPRRLEVLNAKRAEAGLPTAAVDVALHIGEVLYGNVGATDRLDFTVIGPAVNEVTRMKRCASRCGTLCSSRLNSLLRWVMPTTALYRWGIIDCAAYGR